MIDCNETKNYLKERNRMCECFLNECEDCSACFFIIIIIVTDLI